MGSVLEKPGHGRGRFWSGPAWGKSGVASQKWVELCWGGNGVSARSVAPTQRRQMQIPIWLRAGGRRQGLTCCACGWESCCRPGRRKGWEEYPSDGSQPLSGLQAGRVGIAGWWTVGYSQVRRGCGWGTTLFPRFAGTAARTPAKHCFPYQKMDRNRDGVVTIEEFLETCQKVSGSLLCVLHHPLCPTDLSSSSSPHHWPLC